METTSPDDLGARMPAPQTDEGGDCVCYTLVARYLLSTFSHFDRILPHIATPHGALVYISSLTLMS
jgi:hypothetical protein